MKVTVKNEGVGQTYTRQEENLAGTSTEDAIRNSSQATFVLSTDRNS
jgi:hypothetical protein